MMEITSVGGCIPKLNGELTLKSNLAIILERPLTVSAFDEVGVGGPN